MRCFILPLLCATAACSPGQHDQAAVQNNAAAVATGTPSRTIESKSSPAAAQARAVVSRYFDLIKQGKFDAARQLWGHDGAESGGSAKDLAAYYHNYLVFEPTVEDPTDIHVTDGTKYINVIVKTHVKLRSNGKELNQEGPVMLRRPAGAGTSANGGGDWEIWGTDIRVPH